MTKSKHTKSALLVSILSMLLCLTMLIGSTFAWFTDSVTSGKNKIVAGNLDVVLEYSTDPANENSWTAVDENTNLFQPMGSASKWEPGHTEVVYLRVRNAGSLALKYQFSANVFGSEDGAAEKEYTNVFGTSFKLSNYLVFTQIEGANKVTNREDLWLSAEEELTAMGDLSRLAGKETNPLLPGASDTLTLAVYMPTQVGNEANQLTSAKDAEGEPTIYLGINLVATQASDEEDSFGKDYDQYAVYPDATVAGTEQELKEAIAAAEDGDVIALTDNMALTEDLTINKDITIDGNGMTIENLPVSVGVNNNVTFRNVNFANTTAKDDVSSVYGRGLKGSMVFDGCTFGDSNWESIQVTPAGDVTITIKNCTFTATKDMKRFIHVQPAEKNNYQLDITIQNCTFAGCELVNYSNTDKKSVIDLDYIAGGSTMTLGGCTFTNTDGTPATDAHAYFCDSNSVMTYNYDAMYTMLTGEVATYTVQ